MGRRRRSREAAFQHLFANQFTNVDRQLNATRMGMIASDDLQRLDTLAAELLELVETHEDDLRKALTNALQRWSWERIAAPDKALLLLGSAELLYRPDIPPGVTINEYIELSKKYGDDESPKFVNGVLDKVRKDFEAGK